MTDLKLEYLFVMQKTLQEKLKVNVTSKEYLHQMILGILSEVNEVLNETPWKSWKKNQEFNKENFRKEIIDVWAFLINISLIAELTPQELYDEFKEKYKINMERASTDY